MFFFIYLKFYLFSSYKNIVLALPYFTWKKKRSLQHRNAWRKRRLVPCSSFFSTVTFRTSSRIITPCLGLSMVTVEILGMGLDCFPKFPPTFQLTSKMHEYVSAIIHSLLVLSPVWACGLTTTRPSTLLYDIHLIFIFIWEVVSCENCLSSNMEMWKK
jgi:hypothetical protein